MLATSRLAQEKKLIKVELRKLYNKNSDLSMLYVKKGPFIGLNALVSTVSPFINYIFGYSIFNNLQLFNGTRLLVLTL